MSIDNSIKKKGNNNNNNYNNNLWVRCSKCGSTFSSSYCKGFCPVCGKPIQKHEYFEK